MSLKVKKLNPHAVLPKRAHPSDAGLDLTATSVEIVDNQAVYGTGLAISIPDGYVGLLCPRSSIYKKDLILSNSLGVVDSSYRGEIKVIFNSTNMKNKPIYAVGERVCQLVITPIMLWDPKEVNDLDSTDRGTGGFGSTNG